MDTSIPQLAAGAFRQRKTIARRQIAEGRVSEAEAERLLRPWAAIACRVGADLPELADEMAWCLMVGYDEPSARTSIAEALCSHDQLISTLTRARDKAMARAYPTGREPPRDAESHAQAVAMHLLALHFRIPPWCHPPWLAPQEQAA